MHKDIYVYKADLELAHYKIVLYIFFCVGKHIKKDKELQEQMAMAEQQLTNLLCQIPNIPYDEVPEGLHAEDNRVV